ncbi:MAG: DNA primase [Desulfobulbus sp.]|jgi:DNA primase|nr:DNA primase [Desulfobulbus sp.]NLN85916.1 DNA primase [Candidatus Cloacimonadota bacterium]
MDKSLIEAVRRANDIVEVVQSYVPLKHVGSNWRGICPFHNDTNPSMYVSQPKQIFKCFACGKAGNVFTFVQEYEKLTFIEALKKLAARVGINLPEHERTKTVSTKREQLLVIYATARDFFAQNLFQYGQNALKYLQERSFSPETAKTLELGFSLNSEKALLNHLLKEGHAVSLLKESGLFGNYSGNLVDFFRGRLMFPIHNNIGEVIAFGGRVFEGDAKIAKYVNSSGTELYTKGKELYGLFKTKYEISKAGSVLVSEGYFDFLRLYENGFLNSVACLGTAMTEDQIYLLSRYSPKVYMLFDGDAAGISNAVRGALLCLGKGLEAHIVELPPKHDPDSFLLEKGADALRERITAAKPVLRFMAEMESKTPASDRIDQALDALRSLRDPIKRELFARDLAEAFGISTRAVFSKLRRTSAVSKAPETVAPAPILEENFEERHVLILALQDEDAFNLLAQTLSPDYFNNRLYRELFKHLMAEADADSISEPATLLDNIENKDLRDLLAEFLFSEPPQVEFGKALDQIRLRKLQRDMRDLDRRIQADPEDIRLLEEKRKLALTYRSLSRKVVRGLLI